MGSPATKALMFFALCGRFSNFIRACITLDCLLGEAWEGWGGRRSLVELIPPCWSMRTISRMFDTSALALMST
jgi:hypothetical protein